MAENKHYGNFTTFVLPPCKMQRPIILELSRMFFLDRFVASFQFLQSSPFRLKQFLLTLSDPNS